MDGLRIGDAEREAALESLGGHFAEGRLTKDELDERTDAVWSARTRGDLDVLFEDLPARAPGAAARPARRPAGSRRSPWPVVPVLTVLLALVLVLELPLLLLAMGLVLWLGATTLRRRCPTS
jgi:hypothetical protein